MPKMILTIDTDTDLFEVTVNGQTVADATSVTAWTESNYGMDDHDDDDDSTDTTPEPHFRIESLKDNGDHQIRTCIYASDAASTVQSAVASLFGVSV
jgi:hypothetical protein